MCHSRVKINRIYNSPLFSHYSDGVGRTDAFITIHAQMDRMKSEAVHVIDMFHNIKAIRYREQTWFLAR